MQPRLQTPSLHSAAIGSGDQGHILQSVMQDKVVIVSDQEVQVAGALVVHQVDGGAEYIKDGLDGHSREWEVVMHSVVVCLI